MSSPNPFLTPKKKSRDNPFLQDDSLVDLFDPLPELRRDKAARGDKDPEGDMSAYQQAIYGLESGVINIANSYDASRLRSLQKQKNQLLAEGRMEIGKRQVGGEHGYEEPVYLTFESEQIPGLIEHIDTKLKGYAKSLSNNLMIQSGIPRSAVMQEIAEAETFSDAWHSFLKDPMGVMATVTAESFPIMAPALIVAPFNPLLGAVVMGLSSGGIEYGGELLEALAKTGITQEDLIAAGQNEALMAEAEQNGIDRGLIIGTIDALSARLARKMLIPRKLVGRRVGREALNIPAQIVAQMVAGGGGEAAAQLEKSGEITDPGHVFLETVGEGALAPAEVLAFAQKRRGAERDGKERPPPSDDLDQVLGVEPEAAPEEIVQPAAPTKPENPFLEPIEDGKPLRPPKKVEAGRKTIEERPQGAEKPSFAGDQAVNTQFVLVERADLVASHTKEGKKNLNYPQRLQPRDRSRAASQAWAAEKAGRFQPELITEGPSLAEGAPTITPDGVVVSGNGRKILMDAIYRRDSGKADQYKAYLRENAENFGLAAEDIDSLNEPVLVRVLTDEISDQNLIALAQAANVSETAKLSPLEQAKVDADNLTENDLALLVPNRAGDLLVTSNDKFVKAFMAKLTAAEVSNFVSKDGKPLKPLVDRMQAAIFAKAYADDRVLALMAEVANPTLKNIITAMVAAAPEFARARAHGDLGNLDIVNPLLEGMGLLMAARQQQQSIAQFLEQGALFEAAPPMAVVLGKFLEANNKSAVRMGEAFTRIGIAVEEAMLSQKTEDIFGDKPTTLGPIIEQVDAYMTEKYGAKATIGSADLFDQSAAEPEGKPDETEKAEAAEEPAVQPEGRVGEQTGKGEKKAVTKPKGLTIGTEITIMRQSVSGLATEDKTSLQAYAIRLGLSEEGSKIELAQRIKEEVAAIKSEPAEKEVAKPEPKKQLADILNKAIKTFAMEEAGQAILDSMDEAGVSPKEASDIFWEKVYPVLNEKTQKKFQQMLTGLGWEPGMAARKDAEGKVLKLKDWPDVARFFSEDLPPTAEYLEGTERGYVALMAWANGQYEKGKHEGAKEIHAEQIEQAEKETDTDPSEAQIEAENYKTGKVSMHGLKISIENPKGSTRSGTDKDGNEWSQKMAHSYGRILGTIGKDKDHIDIFLGEDADDINMPVFVIDQVLGGAKQFDEHKVMMGFPDEDAARAGYLANYEDGWQGLGEITQMTMGQFKHWLDTADHNRKAAMTFKPQASMIAKPKPAGKFTLADHKKVADRIRAGDITAKELKEKFESLLASEDAIKAELSKRTIKQLAPYGGRGTKKAEIISQVFDSMARRYTPGLDALTWSPFSESYIDALRRQVEKVTDESIQKAAEETKARQEGFTQAMTDPQTYEDFVRFVEYRGKKALNLEQQRRWEKLQAERTKEIKKRALESRQKISKVELGDVKMSVQKTQHTKKGHDLWVVTMDTRVERETFTELRSKAKRLGGYYSSYNKDGAIPGFQFTTEEMATSFMDLQEGEVSAADVDAGRADLSQAKAVERLNDMADKLEAKGKESLSADRLANTAKRARQAASSEDAAQGDIALAKTMRNLAKGIASGATKYLSKIRHKSHVELLARQARLAHYDAARKNDIGYEKASELPLTVEDIDHAKMPGAMIRVPIEQVMSLARMLSSVKGAMRVAKKLEKMATSALRGGKAEWVFFTDIDFVAQVVKKIDATGEKYEGWQLRDPLKEYRQLSVMDITTLPEFKEALREFVEFQSAKAKPDPIKAMERDLIGTKISGYFPTPPMLLKMMVGLADVEHTDTVLEPSAGKGSIVEAVMTGTPALKAENVDVIEIVPTLRSILEKKGMNIVGTDFLALDTEKQYDKILMNPPFENGQDIDHVMKAYEHLKPGGRIVAIMSEGPFFRDDAKSKAFREWLDDKGVSQKNEEGAFKKADRATGVATRMVIIDKPDDAFDFAPAGQARGKSISPQHLQRHMDSITSKWKLAHPQLRITPRVFVVPKANNLPESTLKKLLAIQKRTGKRPRPRGAFLRSKMAVFLVAENIKSLADAERLLFHELLGHYGILITFGKQAAPFLNHAYMVFGKKYLNDIIVRYGFDVKTLKGRQDAAEEGLAKLAEVVNEDSTEQRLKNLWAKFLAKIDGWLRHFGFRSKMSKAELRVTMMKVSRNVRFGLDVVSGRTAEQIALSTEPTDPLAEAFDLKGAIEDDKKTTRTFWQMLQKGQLIDRLFRLPFKFIGQIDEHGAWKVTPRQKAVAKKAVELSKKIAKTSFRWLEPMLGAARTNIIEQYGLDELATKLTRQFLYGFVDKYGQTAEYKQRARQTKAQVRELLMERDDVLNTLKSKGFGIEESKLLQKALTGELIDDADITGVAAPIINAIDEMGGELVLLGMLDKAAYERNRRIYLHRSYQKYEIEGGLAGWVSKFLKSRRQRIVGDQFKRRGIHKQVSLKDLRRSIPASWWGKQDKGIDTNLYNREFIILDKMSYTTNATIDMLPEAEAKRPRMLERVFWPADEAIPAKFNGWENRGTFEVTDVRKGVATLSRDYTREERDQMGEILDARYNIAKTYSMVAHDLASGRFFRDIAKNKDWAIFNQPKDGTWTSAVPSKRKVYSDYDWVHVPETKVPGTSVKSYGDLAGMYVRSAIWIDLNEQEMMANPGMWTKVLRQWKLMKTARSPVVHMNNIMSNLLFMDMADIRMRDLIVGLQSYVSKDSHYLDAVKHGAFSSGFIQQEIDSEVLRPLLKEIVKANLDMNGGIETRLTLVGKLMTGIYNLDKTMTRAYQIEDEVFRMATYMRRLSYGDTPEEAAALANYQFLDYSISAPYINAMKNTVFPFIAYSYRAIPVIASSLAQRPWKLAKYATLAYVANALAYLITDDDEEDEQRRMMREEVSGYTWVGSPRLMRMPWNDEYDNPVFLDVRRWIPAGDVFDLNQGQSGFMPAWLQLSGPLSIGFEVFLNKQSFTGDEITNRLIDTPAEQTGAIANFLWKSSLPSAPWIPGSWYWEKIKRAATKDAVDALGHDYTVPMAIASSMGIKLRSVDPNMQKTQQARQFQTVERALVWEMKMLEYQYANKHIDGDEYLRRKKILEDKLKLLGKKAKYVFTGEEGNQD